MSRAAAIVDFLKEWTLPVSIGTGAALYFLFAFVPALDGAARLCEPVIEAIFPTFLFLVLFVTFCRVDFHKIRFRRWHWWVGATQLVMVAVMVLLIKYYRLEGDNLAVAECVLMCLLAPCASAAPVVTAKLGGNLEDITAFMFLSNLATAVLIPLLFPTIDPGLHMSFWASFLQLLYKVCSVLLLPMALAHVVKHATPRLHRAIMRHPDLSFYFWGCSLVIVTGTTMRNIVHSDATATMLVTIGLLSLVVCVAQFATGRYIGHYTGQAIETGQALGQKNTAFAIWVASAFLHPLSSVGPGCYILWQNLINSAELWRHQHPHDKNT